VSELLSPDSVRLPKFWNSLQQVYIDLYGSRLATVAAIQGHAPAAGCFLAMACDYRVMFAGGVNSDTKKKHVPTIGLNETRLGIAGEGSTPVWICLCEVFHKCLKFEFSGIDATYFLCPCLFSISLQ